jgi:hypothetical protein
MSSSGRSRLELYRNGWAYRTSVSQRRVGERTSPLPIEATGREWPWPKSAERHPYRHQSQLALMSFNSGDGKLRTFQIELQAQVNHRGNSETDEIQVNDVYPSKGFQSRHGRWFKGGKTSFVRYLFRPKVKTAREGVIHQSRDGEAEHDRDVDSL